MDLEERSPFRDALVDEAAVGEPRGVRVRTGVAGSPRHRLRLGVDDPEVACAVLHEREREAFVRPVPREYPFGGEKRSSLGDAEYSLRKSIHIAPPEYAITTRPHIYGIR